MLKSKRTNKLVRRAYFAASARFYGSGWFYSTPGCPGRPGHNVSDDDDDDDVAWVVAFVLSLQRFHSARFNILTKIPGATGRKGTEGRRGVKIRTVSVRHQAKGDGRRWWFAGGVCAGRNFPGVQPRERSLDVQPRMRTSGGASGTKVSRAERATSPMSPRLRWR